MLVADHYTAQRWTLDAATLVMVLLGEYMCVSALLSVTKVKVFPNRYSWNFFTPNITANASRSFCE